MKICPAGSWLFQRQPTLWLPNAYLWKTIRAVAEQSCSYKGGSGPQQIYQQQKQQCINHPGLFHCHGCVSHRPMFRLPVVVLSSVRQFSSISSVNEMSSGCFARAQQGESNDEVTTSLLLDQRGVWLRLTHNVWTVQKGSSRQKLRYHWYSSQSHWCNLLPWQDKVETPSRSFNRKVMLQNWPIPYLQLCTGLSLDKLLAFDPKF